MTEGLLDDAAFADHIQTCTVCAKLATADRQLSRLLHEAVNAETVPTTPISIVRERIETIAAGGQRKDNRIMSNIFTQFRIHPRISWGLALAVALFLFVSLVPFSYQRIAGYESTVAFNSEIQIAPEHLKSALAAVGQSGVKVGLELTDAGSVFHLKGLPSQLAARQAVAVINSLAGAKGESHITPVYETISASLYAQARDRIISIEIDGAGKSDAELESEITSKLTEAGLTADQVSVTTGSDGTRQISVSASSNSANTGDSAQIQLKVNGDSNVGFKMISCEADENMTDAEAKAAIEARLAEQGITNAEVVVTRDAEGKRKVEVKAQK
jgi:pentose-5-phosphate-3-epimerase